MSPQEYERSLLRTGQRAPERLATPKSLLEVLRRRLAEKSGPAKSMAQSMAKSTTVAVTTAQLSPVPPLPAKALPAKSAPPKAAASSQKPLPVKPSVALPSGAFAVQVAAFANRASADATAKKVGGMVSAAGRLWRVRIGPFATRAEAGTAQARVRKAGIGNAQIVPSQAVSGK